MIVDCINVTHNEFIFTDQGEEETAIGVYWITDGIDRCLVGFLPRYLVRYSTRYEGKLAQVVKLHNKSQNPLVQKRSQENSGMCAAVVINANK